MKKYTRSLFIFRRDLRLDDNTALLASLELSHSVIACFIFDPRQVGDANSYKSLNALQFMIESLQELADNIKKKSGKLYFFYGIAHDVVAQLIAKNQIEALFCNKDYTPFSMHRDDAIAGLCFQHNIDFNHYNDLLLTNPEDITTGNGTPYEKFTPFFKNASSRSIAKPQKLHRNNFFTGTLEQEQPATFLNQFITKPNAAIARNGGSHYAFDILSNLQAFTNYAHQRNYPEQATTGLSAHLKFGTVSIRQAYHAIVDNLGKDHLLIQQLFWRDFFTHVAYHSPFVFGQAFQKKYNLLEWDNNKDFFDAWCNGMTGFPLVDAGMRQLNATGFMHNRVRMVVASFLTKDLHIDWRWGERYFAQQLVDYDPAVNNGNWQWCASTGCDAQPYFRIFNPWLQQKKFDPDCIYIKRWVPELASLSPKIIHTLYKQKNRVGIYPQPIVQHDVESKRAKILYKQAR